MRFLVDECTGPAVARWLESQGHDVFSAYHQARGNDDDALLSKAFNDARVLITNDRDFGELIFREQRQHAGVIFLRLADERSTNKIAILRQLLTLYSDRIEGNFLTVTETKIRIG